jgi:hypothetical protein
LHFYFDRQVVFVEQGCEKGFGAEGRFGFVGVLRLRL